MVTISSMATSSKATLSTNDFQIVWLDNHTEDVKQSDYINRNVDLGYLIEHLKIYKELSQCMQYIISLDNADKVFLIVSGSAGEKILPTIHGHTNYIYIHLLFRYIQTSGMG